jgi:hypothetical protein
MTVAQKIEQRINRLPVGDAFKYDSLNIKPEDYSAAAKAMQRFIEKGIVKRISTGLFYKPKESMFGEFLPREEKLIEPYLYEDGKRIAYITGLSLYNRLGLTTQIPKTLKIASRDKRIYVKNKQVSAKPVKSYVDVTEDNYNLLGLLDALKDFTIIPDLDKQSGIKLLINKISELGHIDQDKLINYGLKYPPRARALLGALMEQGKVKLSDIDKLRGSLNPLSEYDLGISSILNTANNWNIK